MTKEELLRHWQRRPFEPFRILTTVGEAIEVVHPGLMLVAGDTVTVGRPRADAPPPMAEDGVWFDLSDIAHIEPLETTKHR
jgi:hypothetical protein